MLFWGDRCVCWGDGQFSLRFSNCISIFLRSRLIKVTVSIFLARFVREFFFVFVRYLNDLK